ncbi:MAG: c-type cytochrome domain-containing protein, partial [Bryobacteraceae bacterium]
MERALLIAGLCAASLSAQDFAKDVAPIFAANCIGCHSGSAKMGGLDLDTMESIAKGGNHGKALIAGKSDESRLYLMVTGKLNPPMPLATKTLAAGEMDVIRRWIDAGASPGVPVVVSQLNKSSVPELKPRTVVKPQIGSLAYRPDGKLLALGAYKEVRLADATGKALGVLSGHAEAVRALAFSRDGTLLAAAGG